MNSSVLIAFGATWVVLLMAGVLLAGVIRYLGDVHERLASSVPQITKLAEGQAVPSFELPDLSGRSLRSGELFGDGSKALLLLLTGTCAECEVISRQIGELCSRPGGMPGLGWRIVLAWYGDRDTVLQRVTPIPRDAPGVVLLHDEKAQLARDLLVSSLPVGIALDEQGRVAGQSANPGPNWLYRTLRTEAPERPLEPAWVPEITTRG